MSIWTVSALFMAGWLATPGSTFQVDKARHKGQKEVIYDGNWWVVAHGDERVGFLEGASDCLTWILHQDGFAQPSNQIKPEIDRFYATHQKDRKLHVTTVWRKIASKARYSRGPEDGENWQKPHWYLNGLWWRQTSTIQNRGFVEGYLWCVRNCAEPTAGTYSHLVNYYTQKVDEYIRNNPSADDEPVADILRRFRDGQEHLAPK